MTAKLRNTLVASAVILAVVIGILIAWGQVEHRAYLTAKGAAAALTAEFNAFKATTEPFIASLQSENANLTKTINAAISTAAALEADIIDKDFEIAHLKALTAALSPDSLSGQINQRIGTGSMRPTESGLYICSRAGTEATLNRFLDGEGYASKYESEKAVSLNLRAAVDAAEQKAANSDQAFTLKDGEYRRALAGWDADKQVIKHLERSILGRRTKSFVIGVALGVASVLIFQLAKGK